MVMPMFRRFVAGGAGGCRLRRGRGLRPSGPAAGAAAPGPAPSGSLLRSSGAFRSARCPPRPVRRGFRPAEPRRQPAPPVAAIGRPPPVGPRATGRVPGAHFVARGGRPRAGRPAVARPAPGPVILDRQPPAGPPLPRAVSELRAPFSCGLPASYARVLAPRLPPPRGELRAPMPASSISPWVAPPYLAGLRSLSHSSCRVLDLLRETDLAAVFGHQLCAAAKPAQAR